jgi:hypothetical protein
MTKIQRSKFTTWTFILFVLVIFYSTGAGFLESFVNYPLWHIIGPSPSWVHYHTALGPKIIVALAIPSLPLSLILNILLIFFRPLSVPKWTVWTCLVMLLVAFISTIAIQIPIQIELDKGYSYAKVEQLITTSFWLRDLVGLVRIPVICYMIFCAIQKD